MIVRRQPAAVGGLVIQTPRPIMSQSPPARMRLAFVLLAMLQAALFAAVVEEVFFGGIPLGGHNDFLAYYTASDFMRLESPQLIYDPNAVSLFQHGVLGHYAGALGYMPFLNPPFVAAAFQPISAVSLHLARDGWFLANVGLASAVAFGLTKNGVSRWRFAEAALLTSTFPMYQAFAEGQLSIVLLAGCYFGMTALQRHWPVRGGVGLSLLWIKPQLGLLVLGGLLLCRCWRTAATMLIGLLATIFVTLPEVGLSPYRSYPAFLLRTARDHVASGSLAASWSGDLARTQGLNGLFNGWFGVNAATSLAAALTLLALVALFAIASRRVRPGVASAPQKLMVIAGVNLVLLADPHLYAQDLVLYLTVLPLVSVGRSSLAATAGMCALLDVSGMDIVFPAHVFTALVVASTVVILALVLGRPSAIQGIGRLVEPNGPIAGQASAELVDEL